MLLTVEQVMSWEPCEDYDREKLEEIAQAIDLPNITTAYELIEKLRLLIPAKDIRWLLNRGEIVSENREDAATPETKRALFRESLGGEPELWLCILEQEHRERRNSS